MTEKNMILTFLIMFLIIMLSLSLWLLIGSIVIWELGYILVFLALIICISISLYLLIKHERNQGE